MFITRVKAFGKFDHINVSTAKVRNTKKKEESRTYKGEIKETKGIIAYTIKPYKN